MELQCQRVGNRINFSSTSSRTFLVDRLSTSKEDRDALRWNVCAITPTGMVESDAVTKLKCTNLSFRFEDAQRAAEFEKRLAFLKWQLVEATKAGVKTLRDMANGKAPTTPASPSSSSSSTSFPRLSLTSTNTTGEEEQWELETERQLREIDGVSLDVVFELPEGQGNSEEVQVGNLNQERIVPVPAGPPDQREEVSSDSLGILDAQTGLARYRPSFSRSNVFSAASDELPPYMPRSRHSQRSWMGRR